MIGVYEDAKRETGYNATRFIQMVSERGGVATARHLVLATTPSDGFTALWERGRLDLTVEHLILDPVYSDLFTDDERAMAQGRLDSYQGGDR
jgi:hypothetical protein